MNTRKYPRTMQAAFGPHTDHNLQPMPDRRPMDWQDRVVLTASIIVGAVFVALLAVGVIV